MFEHLSLVRMKTEFLNIDKDFVVIDVVEAAEIGLVVSKREINGQDYYTLLIRGKIVDGVTDLGLENI